MPVTAGEDDRRTTQPPPERPRRIFLHTYVVTALNPKSIIFFVAFVPQFLDTARPIMPQMMILEVTFLVLAALNAAVYSLLASMARRSIRKPGMQRWVNRVGGSLMIGAGALAAAWRRSAA